MSRDAKLSVLEFAGLCLILMAFTVLLGHVLEWNSLMTWGMGSDMAPPTAICFILIGLSKFLLASALKKNGHKL